MEVKARSRGRLKAAWTLVILVPVCAELTFTAVAVPLTWLALPLLIPIYGAGVLLIREAVVRVGGGWPSLVVLGLAYELAEDGLGLQALTSPNMYDVSDWSLRVLGFNLTYWESQLGIHVVFSVLVPVMLLDLLFPRHRGRPYLRTGGLIGTGAAAVVGVVLVRFSIAATQDPGYQVPVTELAGITVAIAILAVIALRVLPGRGVPAKPLRSRPVVVGLVAAVATFGFLGLLMPVGLSGDGPVFGDAVPLVLPMLGAAAVAVAAGWLVRRWAAGPGWSDSHRLWLAGGILVSHTAFMIPGNGTASLVTGGATIVVEVIALVLLARVVRRRPVTAVVLIGLMGTGKTTTAKLLSRSLGLPMTDSDGYLNEHYGRSAAEMVETEGAEVLHARERDHVLDSLAQSPRIIAAGASVVESPAVRRAMEPAYVVWLDAPAEVLERRMRSSSHRPDFDPAMLRARREPYYRELADFVVDVGANRPEQVAELVLADRDGAEAERLASRPVGHGPDSGGDSRRRNGECSAHSRIKGRIRNSR